MMQGAISLQKAILNVLKADKTLTEVLGADRIFDQVPFGMSFPYVAFGPTVCRDWSTTTDTGHEHFLTLEIWSRNCGRKQVLEIADAIGRCLKKRHLHLDGYVLVNLCPSETNVRNTDGAGGYLGTMRYRAVLEPLSKIRRR